MPQYRIQIKDVLNDTTETVSVWVDTREEASRAAIKQARFLLGHDQLEIVGILASER